MSIDDLLQQVEAYGYLQFSDEMISDVLEAPSVTKALVLEQKKISAEDEQIRRAALRGKLKGEADLRRVIIRMALEGNPQAQKYMLGLVDERKIKDGDE